MQAEEIIDLYCKAWDEPNTARREALLHQALQENAAYTDPTVHVAGIAALSLHIGTVLGRYPGSKIARLGALDGHHEVGRFSWRKVLADGTALPEGVDFVEFGNDGRLTRIVGFFGPRS
jgi:hypothetical protein